MRWSLRFLRQRKPNAARHDDFRISQPRNRKHLLGITVIYCFEKLTSSYKLGSPPLVRSTAPISNVPMNIGGSQSAQSILHGIKLRKPNIPIRSFGAGLIIAGITHASCLPQCLMTNFRGVAVQK